jgi:hypothetical protein
MNIGKTILMVAMLMTLFFMGCTNKSNPVGSDWSHIRPASITDTLFTNHFSYTTAFKLTGNEQRLVIGSYDQKQAKALIQFSSFPDSIYQVVGTPKLSLVVQKRFSITPLTLHFGKVVQNWSESQATWTNAYSDTTWQASYVTTSGIVDFSDIPDTIEVGGDTLHIDIPASTIQNWKTPGITGFTLQISTEQANYLEVRSTESLYAPKLVFSYKKSAADTTTYSYEHSALNDSFILQDTNSQLTSENLILRDISPTRLFMKFNIPGSLFTYNGDSGDTLSSIDLKHMTINKAELVLKVKDNPYYGNSATFMATVYRAKSPITNMAVITDDDMEFITYTPITTTSPGLGTVSINFTPVMQAFTSGVKQNNGIIIRLSTENQDYSKVEFYGMTESDLSKRPKINIIYTPPAF